jgi:hypothetical protein
MPNSGVGRDVPCQPRRNSSINFAISHITDQRIQNKAEHSENLRELRLQKAQHRSTTGHLSAIGDMETSFAAQTPLSGNRAVPGQATPGLRCCGKPQIF